MITIDERRRDIGNFPVGRLLPDAKKRMVGPFIFIDHMGPTTLGPDHYMDVDQHPHIGLATLTYLLEGEILHADSLGSNQLISPGSVNWMVAGHGVTHTERTPTEKRNGSIYQLHGYQIWIALPKEAEDTKPSFHHVPESDLPAWAENGIRFKLIAGSAYGQKSPVPVYSDMYMLDVKSDQDAIMNTDNHLTGEVAFCPITDTITVNGEPLFQKQLVVFESAENLTVSVSAGARFLIFGGMPLAEPRFINWNFVHSSKDKIIEARQRWTEHLFPSVPGDTSYVHLPK